MAAEALCFAVPTTANANPIALSLVIPAFNEAATLPRTLAALRDAAGRVDVAHEVVVVDNHSTDATAAVAREHGADRVVFEPINQIARARDAGARAAAGRWLVFVDADTQVSAELLSATVSTLRSGASGGGAVVAFDRPVGLVPRWLLWLWNTLSRLRRWAAGCYVFATREAWEAAGGFGTKDFAGEEVGFSQRVGRWGKRHGPGEFVILTQTPAVTSARKIHAWHRVMPSLLLMGLLPWTRRCKALCGWWYRPAGRSQADPPAAHGQPRPASPSASR